MIILHKTDFLIVGAGIAGLRAAIELAGSGKVLVLAKGGLQESSSEYAQGGIAAALAEDDDVSLHEQDTLFAGDGLCDVPAVRVLVEEAPEAIEQLIAWGAEFDREGSKLLFAREGAHSRNRILHAHGDSTGQEIARTLYRKAAGFANIEFRAGAMMTDLIVSENGAVLGAAAWDEKTGSQFEVRARAVLLATGGLGRVFSETTNPDVATGDGVAAAFRAGAACADLEFVQFHPTALFIPGAPRFLLSEALRGEGAHLINTAGERFMPRYHALGDLAPRDVVSRAIVTEIERGRALSEDPGDSTVRLDLTHLNAGHLRERFPRIYSTCLKYGMDITAQPVPVHPAAHYSMGGVRTDLDARASLNGLFAAGEAACTGVHGANRLASNSLLEGLVFGARAGRAMLGLVGVRQESTAPSGCKQLFPEVSESELRKLTWNLCGIVRSGAGLDQALHALDVGAAQQSAATRAGYELRNMHTLAKLIARAALARTESRGAHYRLDFPQKRAEFQKHSVLVRGCDVQFV